jgi:hypothetical protein
VGARADARAALVSWLENADIVGLDRVYPTYPLRWDFLTHGSGDHRCQVSVDFEADGELRIAIGGEHSGKKRIDYLVCLDIFHRSTNPDTAVGMNNFDRILDELKERLRADRRLSADESVIWQAGEGGYGIQTEFEKPDHNVGGEPTELRARMRFEITQWITS